MDGPGVAVRAPFVGRQDELAWLERTLDRARKGRPGIAVITGEAGIGKTRLLRELARRARRAGFKTLTGAGYEDLRGPFFPFVDALDDVVHDLSGTSPELEQVRDLIDVILGRRPTMAQEVPADPSTAQVRILRDLTRALFILARRSPVVLCVDDLHWADGPSLQLLEHLALRLDDESYDAEPLPLLVVASGRSDEEGAWAATLARLRGEEAVTLMRLAGFGAPEVADLLRASSPEAVPVAVIERLARVTRGNPLHLESLVAGVSPDQLVTLDEVRLGSTPLPDSMSQAVAGRLRSLDPSVVEVLQVIAVTCGEADAGLIATVLDRARADIEAAFAAAVDAGVLTVGVRPDLTHPVLRHVCLGDIPPAQLRVLHALVLEGLLSIDAGAENPDRMARHAIGAGDFVDRELRATLAIDAAHVRLAATDWAAAAELFDAARALGPAAIPDLQLRADVELNSALCHAWSVGFDADLDDRFRNAAVLYDQIGNQFGVTMARLAAIRTEIGRTPWGQPVDVAILEDQLARVGGEDPALAAQVRADLAMALWVAGRSEQAADAARQAVALATELDHAPAAVRGYVALGVSLLTLLDFAGSRDALERGLVIAERSGDRNLELMVLIRLPLVTGLVGDIVAFERFATRALELTRSLDAAQEGEFALAALCNLAGSRGDFITTEQTGAEVRSIARLTGSPWAEPFVLAAMAATRALHGDSEGASEAATALLPDDPGLAEWVADSPAHRVLAGYLAVLDGQLSVAAERVDAKVVQDLLEQPAVLGNGAHLAAVVEVARALDQADMAESVRPALADLIGRGQMLSAGMPFLLPRSLAVIDLLGGRLDEARGGLESARSFAARSGLRVEEVRATLDLADLLAVSGDRRGSTDLRAEAAQTVESLELWALAPRAGVRSPVVSEPVHRSLTTMMPMEQASSVVLFADISSSTALTEELGDIAFRHRARQAESVMRAAVGLGGGWAIEGIRLGDGILAEFPSVRGAIIASLSMIEDMAATGLRVHVGVHSGAVIRDARSIFGGAVNMAARICDVAGPGELVVSAPVADGLQGSELHLTDLGPRSLKGFDLPVNLYAVTAASES